MNHSKPGLNEPFYKWLDEVRRAIRKEKVLKEKLTYYNVKLIGYKGVVYDRIGSAGTAGHEKDLYYWMDRIHAAEIELTAHERKRLEIITLETELTEDEKQVLESLIDPSLQIDTQGDISRSYRYQLINQLVMKWNNLKSISKTGLTK
ncbi:MAG: hypothetical protein WC477_05255 [Patescibacteria group bacterium]